MSSPLSFASILTTCVLAVGLLGFVPAADTASAGQSALRHGKSARNYVIDNKRHGRSRRIHLPIGPSYVYYDYPYYYSRGYYPTHIGGYVYYPYYYYRIYYRGPGSHRARTARRH
jgi:hypothetical protein